MPSYKKLLYKHCAVIVKSVLAEMQLCKVGSEGGNILPHDPVLYRWWFPDSSKVLTALRDFSCKDAEMADLLKKVETRQIDGEKYHALYFGKSNDGHRRFANHTFGDVRHSTLGLSVYGLCVGDQYDEANEEQINSILNECYLEWLSFQKEGDLVECLEKICIASGNYPLNLDGNPAISDSWRRKMMGIRRLK